MREPTSLRRLWKMYQEKMVEAQLTAHELRLMREAFYMGSISTCRILMHLSKRGETERMAKIIGRTAAHLENAEKAKRRFRN